MPYGFTAPQITGPPLPNIHIGSTILDPRLQMLQQEEERESRRQIAEKQIAARAEEETTRHERNKEIIGINTENQSGRDTNLAKLTRETQLAREKAMGDRIKDQKKRDFDYAKGLETSRQEGRTKLRSQIIQGSAKLESQKQEWDKEKFQYGKDGDAYDRSLTTYHDAAREASDLQSKVVDVSSEMAKLRLRAEDIRIKDFNGDSDDAALGAIQGQLDNLERQRERMSIQAQVAGARATVLRQAAEQERAALDTAVIQEAQLAPEVDKGGGIFTDAFDAAQDASNIMPQNLTPEQQQTWYDAIPSGAEYVAPDGTRRRKS